MLQTCDKLFVYGTLMSAFVNSMSGRLNAGNRLLGPASLNGHLYDLNGYPGVIHDPCSETRIHGELYEIFEAEETLLWLDRYEVASPEFNLMNEYQRILIPVNFRDQKINAWMYHYIKSTKNLIRIPSGNYLEYVTCKM
ncbi:MAG: gamma-glutamylcyclotransferase [Cyclobacteriaceae bacterium]|nr:gamma-glutamylcyclotransferase [Cyclobacteriaceae bacterium]